jgi:TolB-like protein/Tfp pilus assembly protein PilF
MGEESPKPPSAPTGAVFLSYASQDAEPARKICDALRAAGIEVWFDRSELRGGDAWDQKIRRQIKSCALFLPVISEHTHERAEGYFRLEWKLAVDRSHLIMANKAFLVPVVIDQTTDGDENVPDKFREVQWTRLPAGDTPPAFVRRIEQLLAGVGLSPALAHSPAAVAPGKLSSFKSAWLAVAVVIAAGTAYLFIQKPWIAKSAPPTASAFNPPPHSIAVLPFVNMSGDTEQEYFSDGLTEELLNSLTEINELQVAARTSAFSFKGTNTDIGTIARKLNVGAVLEGSVRRSGNTVRVTTQLINAITGFHLWSHSYDRNLGDVLKLETDIAGDVAGALKVSLLGNEAAKIELGGTRNPAAFDAYLRGRKTYTSAHSNQDDQTAVAAYTQAVGLDPNYALAYADRSIALSDYAGHTSAADVRESFEKALTDARKALALAPDLAEGHLAMENYLESGVLDFTRAMEEYERALALAPGNAWVLVNYGVTAVLMGRTEAGLAAARRAVVLDPLSRDTHRSLASALYFARQYKEAITASQDALALDPEDAYAYATRGLAAYALGDFEDARASCESKADNYLCQMCLAVTYDKIGRHADAEAQLTRMQASFGDNNAYQYAAIYGQWGNVPKALGWLEKALRLRDPGFSTLKADSLFDPLRKQPRFQAIERDLKFPQ